MQHVAQQFVKRCLHILLWQFVRPAVVFVVTLSLESVNWITVGEASARMTSNNKSGRNNTLLPKQLVVPDFIPCFDGFLGTVFVPSMHWNTVGLMQTDVQKYWSCEQTHSVVCDNVHKVFSFVECCMDEQSCSIMTWKNFFQDHDAFASVLLRKSSRSMERNAIFRIRKICFSKTKKTKYTLSVQVSCVFLWIGLFECAELCVRRPFPRRAWAQVTSYLPGWSCQ